MIATPLRRDCRTPLYPVECPICGARLGALYRDGLTLRMFARPCTDRCVRLWGYGRGRASWRDYPAVIRQVYLAAGLLEYETRQATAPASLPDAVP
jgi:hypothetical protein